MVQFCYLSYMYALKLFPFATDGEDGHGLNKFKIAMPAKITKKIIDNYWMRFL